MKSKTTILWFMLAAALATAIWVLDTYFKPVPPGEKRVFTGLRADQVTGIQVIPAGAREITVIRTNQAWLLEKPMVYPAQAAAIEGLLGAMEKLTPVISFTPGEMSARKDADAEFGFDNPQFTLDVVAGDRTWHVRVGNKTATGDGVYVRIVGATGAFTVDTAWLQFLPHDVAEWRDTTLANVPDALDWLVVTNGTQAIELRRGATNRLWRMVRPLASRANDFRIVSAVGQLQTARISRFVTDDPKADLTTYGLEPASIDIWMGSGTNLLSAVHGGKEVPGMPGEAYARREGWNTVVTVPKSVLAAWCGTVNDFRDPNVVDLTADVAEIEVRGPISLTFQRGSNAWTIVGQKFPVDPERVKQLVKALAGLRITDFVQDVVTPARLQSYGLASPDQQVTLRSVPGDTNHVIARIFFGATSTNNLLYVKRADEDFVYGIAPGVLDLLKLPADYYRSPQVWKFSEADVAEITIHQNGKVRQLVRNGTNNWSLAAGQGVIEPHAVEETVHQLGNLQVVAWIGRKFDPADVGVTTNSLSMTIDLKSGEKYSLDFGQRVESGNQTIALAVATLGGERWAFIFPSVLCELVGENLTIPASAP